MQRNRSLGLLLAGMGLFFTAGTAALAVPPPAPWAAYNIGTMEAQGSVNIDARGLWTMRAFNGDVLPSVDSVYFVGHPLDGDGSVLALLLGQEGGNAGWARSGVMIREDEAPGARNVFFHMTSGHGLGLTLRRITSFPATDEGADTRYGERRFPIWIRLQRQGDAVTPFISSDGFGWTQVHAPLVVPGLRKDALVGLAASTLFIGPMTTVFSNPTVAPGQLSPLVQATVGSGSILLSWPPVAGALGYLVRRSAPDVPGFAADMLTLRPIKETSFADTNAPNGRPFRYLVSPIFKEGEEEVEGWATAVQATAVATPDGFLGSNIDIETTRLAGTMTFDPSTGVYRVSGAGGDIWDTSDRFLFASKPVTGDFQITARLMERPDRKGGIMIRETLDGPSRMVLLAGTQESGVVYQYRDKTGASASWPGRPAMTARDFTGTIYLRLVRKGATVTSFISTDGTTFTPAGPARTFTPALANTLYVGLATTSQNPGRTGGSVFSNLSIGPAP